MHDMIFGAGSAESISFVFTHTHHDLLSYSTRNPILDTYLVRCVPTCTQLSIELSIRLTKHVSDQIQ